MVSKHIHTRRKREVVDSEGKKTHKEESAAVLSLLLCPSCTHVFLSALSLSLHLPAAIPCCLNSVLLPSRCVWSASLLQWLETGKVWADKHDYTDMKWANLKITPHSQKCNLYTPSPLSPLSLSELEMCFHNGHPY